MIRAAEERDAQSIATILNHAMRPGMNATARTTPVTAEDRLGWLREFREPFGAWVYELPSGLVAGWCSLGAFPVRRGYLTVAEISAYVHEDHWRGGIGARMLAWLVRVARLRGFRSLMSISNEKNVVSISGCLAAGFEPCAVLLGVAGTRGTFNNVAWIQKDLSVEDPPVLVSELRRIERSLSTERVPSAAARSDG